MNSNNNNIIKCDKCLTGDMSQLITRTGLINYVCSHCDNEIKYFELKSKIDELITADNNNDKIKALEQTYQENVFGYNDLKPFIIDIVKVHYLNLSPHLNKPNHLLLVGEAGTCKTYFFELMQKVFSPLEFEFLNSATASGTGITNYLNDSKKIDTLKFLVLDELDKMGRENQFKLLTALESGIMKEIKFKRYIELDVSKILFLATANEKDKIYQPLLTRFVSLDIPHYSYQDYRRITDGWIKKKFPNSAEQLIKTAYPLDRDLLLHERLHIRTLKKMVSLSLGNPNKLQTYLNTLESYSSDSA